MTGVMEDRPERVAQFKEEIASMRLRDPSTARDRQLFRLGVALMVLGGILGVYAYTLSHGTSDARQQNDAIRRASVGVSSTIAGAALFVRYSVAQFLRFWLARLTYEQQ